MRGELCGGRGSDKPGMDLYSGGTMGDRGDQGRPGDPDTPVTHQTLASHNTRDAGLILILIKAFNHRDITINYSLKSSMPCRFKLLLRESV